VCSLFTPQVARGAVTSEVGVSYSEGTTWQSVGVGIARHSQFRRLYAAFAKPSPPSVGKRDGFVADGLEDGGETWLMISSTVEPTLCICKP
jgi:hypothetical protein